MCARSASASDGSRSPRRRRPAARRRAGTRCRLARIDAARRRQRRARRPCFRARGCCRASGTRSSRSSASLRERLAVERQPLRRAVAREEALREHRDVDLPLAQRRQPDRERVDAVVEIFAEPAVADELLERPVGRRDQAEVDRDRLVAAEALEAPLLEHAQQLGLRDERHVADLVEEQRAVVGQLEAARLAIVRAGERAFFVAEDFRLEQRVGQRRAVDRLELVACRAGSARGSSARRLPCPIRSVRGSAPRCRTSRRCGSTRRRSASSRRGRSSRGSAGPTATDPRC